MYNLELSAGNQKNVLILSLIKWFLYSLGSSETTRDPLFIYNDNIVHKIKNLSFTLMLLTRHIHTARYFKYSSQSSLEFKNNSKDFKPIKKYDNFYKDRYNILKEEKNKTGIYCLVNNINGHSYVGSSVNISSRMKNYLNKSFLKSRSNINMPITKALLKYDQSNFSLLILEYTEPELVSIRETFYITQFLPYYNVLKQGYSSLGYKHTEETKKLLRELASKRTHSELTKSLIAKALTGENNPFYNKSHSTQSKLRMIEANSAYPVYLYNSKKQLLIIFPSVLTLAKRVQSNHSTLVNLIKNNTIFRGEWYLSNIPYNIEDTPLISNIYTEECNKLISCINDSKHIKKAVFVYNTSRKFIGKYDGVTQAQKFLHINHSIIKKHAELNTEYKGFIFSYEKLN